MIDLYNRDCLEVIDELIARGTKEDICEWLHKNCDFVSIHGTSAIAIYKKAGYEVYGKEDAVVRLLKKIRNKNIDYKTPGVNRRGYAPELFNFDEKKERGW